MLLDDKIKELVNQLRPGQQELVKWDGGTIAVSAVPGAGKSHGLAVATAVKIAQHHLNHNHYLLIVTYTRSAVASIKQKIQEILLTLNLPLMGFSVQTIHGLALNIATRYPDLSQLNLDVNNLVDITPSHPIMIETVETWMNQNNHLLLPLLKGGKKHRIYDSDLLQRKSVLRLELLPSFAHNVIRIAKSSRWTVEDLTQVHYYDHDYPYPLMAIASSLYQEYQNITQKYNIIDYEDLILGGLRVLDNDIARETLQREIFGVFEDEAQDSSPLQTDLLTILAQKSPHDEPNLIRVGDPNQAINTTFTASDSFYFSKYCDDCRQKNKLYSMPQAGRSSEIIIKYANKTLKWIERELNKNQEENTSKLVTYQEILTVAKSDSHIDSNPPPEGKGVEIYRPKDIYKTVELMGERIIKLLRDNPTGNVGILTRQNKQGSFIFQYLKSLLVENNIEIKLINDQQIANNLAKEIWTILKFLQSPQSSQYLKNTLVILNNRQIIQKVNYQNISQYPEKFLYPTKLDNELTIEEKKARNIVLKILKAKLELSSYQLVSFLCGELKYQQSELATIQKLTDVLDREIKGKGSLQNLINALEKIINHEKFEAIEEENEDVYMKEKQVTIMTMHKAKGLQWDYVFLPFLHEEVLPGENYLEKNKKFLGEFNLTEVIRYQLRDIIHSKRQQESLNCLLSPELIWKKATMEKKAEEYRLLYVAMTRAKKLLWMSSAKSAPSWNFFVDFKDRNSLKEDKKPSPVINFLLDD